MNANTRYSRLLATVARIDAADGGHRFLHKSVLLRCDSRALETSNGRVIFRTAVRLLIRCSPGLVVAVEDSQLRDEAKAILAEADAGGSIGAPIAIDPVRFDAILTVGPTIEPDLPDTAVWSDGWRVLVSSTESMEWGDGIPNAVGAVAAAALGVGEIFKRLIEMKPERGRYLDRQSFSLLDYTADGPTGEPLRTLELPHFLQVGAGAIGNGIALVLLESTASGSLTLVDYQDFQPENWGTCVLMAAGNVGHSKAEVIADALNVSTRFKAEHKKTMIEDFDGPTAAVVISALDSPEARRALQLMWPDVVIDGAIGDFPCEVGVHPWGPDVACLRCWFDLPVGPSTINVQVAATGLPAALLEDPDALVADAHVNAAPAGQRDFWSEHRGEPVCSVVAEAVAAAMSLGKVGPGFQPSVPFVACFSAAMIVGELFKIAIGLETPLEPRFQFDFRWGPARGLDLPLERVRSCDCVMRRDVIEAVRNQRVLPPPSSIA